MIIDHITIIVEPDDFHLDEQSRNGIAFPSPVEYLRLLDFKERLEGLIGIEVKLVNDYLCAAPLNGIIVFCPRRRGFEFDNCLEECSEKLRDSLSRRLLLINIFRGTIFELLEKHKLVGAVEDLDMSYWWKCENRVVPKQAMHGLTRVAAEMKSELLNERGDYCHFEGDKNECFPYFLVRYLNAYVNMFNQSNLVA